VHEDAFGLADDVAAGKSSREVLFCGGAGQGDRGVLGEDLPGGDRVVGEGTRRSAVQVESTEASAMTKRRNDSMQGVVARAAASLDPRHTLTEGGQRRTWNPREG
jgi:hypothetical protein